MIDASSALRGPLTASFVSSIAALFSRPVSQSWHLFDSGDLAFHPSPLCADDSARFLSIHSTMMES